MSTEVVGHPTGSALGVVTAMLSIGVIVVRAFYAILVVKSQRSYWLLRRVHRFLAG